MSPFYTQRPVPLEHYIFPAGDEGLHLVVDNKGRFRENNFQVNDGGVFPSMQDPPLASAVAFAGAKSCRSFRRTT